MAILSKREPVPILELDALNRELEAATPRERILWAQNTFGDGLVVSTSFGAYSAVMLHLVQQTLPGTPVLFVDTGYLTPETYRFKREITNRLNLQVRTYLPARSRAEREALDGTPEQTLAAEDGARTLSAELKVEPLERALRELGATAWMSGVMRGETDVRQAFQVVVPRDDGLAKVHPILDWTKQDCRDYLRMHDLPVNPGYQDICKPEHKECGIHLTGIEISRVSSEL